MVVFSPSFVLRAYDTLSSICLLKIILILRESNRMEGCRLGEATSAAFPSESGPSLFSFRINKYSCVMLYACHNQNTCVRIATHDTIHRKRIMRVESKNASFLVIAKYILLGD